MANGICDICNTRPASLRAQIVENGQRRTVELCDVDYRAYDFVIGAATRDLLGRSDLPVLFSR